MASVEFPLEILAAVGANPDKSWAHTVALGAPVVEHHERVLPVAHLAKLLCDDLVGGVGAAVDGCVGFEPSGQIGRAHV